MIARISPRSVVRLFRRELDGPVDVVNLIATARFELYRWYGLLLLPLLAAAGGRLLWMGRFERSLAGEPQADKLLILRYPSHRRFLAMTLNPYYVAINRLREAGVRRFEASFTRPSHTDPELGRRRLLVAVHFASPPGRDALAEVVAAAAPVAGELVYATREAAAIDVLDPPRDTDPHPLRLPEVALFAPEDGELPAAGLAELGARLAELTADCSLQAYRREPRAAYRPALLARLATAALLALPAAAAAQTPAIPIPGPLDGPLPRFAGEPAEAQPLDGPFPPQNPALAPDGTSGSGLAAGNGAASPHPGPLGHATEGASALQFGTCASLAFDAGGRLLAVCNGPVGPALRLLDPDTLATVATLPLPPRRSPDRTDLAGGTHLLVRADGSLLVPTNDGTLAEVAVEPAALRQTRTVSLAGLLAAGERPFAVAAGFDGRDWVAGNQGTVVALPRDGGPPRALALGEPVAEDVATDPTGTYVVTTAALYRLRAGSGGAPEVVWRQPIAALPPAADAGRIHPGSGTPPVVVAGTHVAVADALDPPRVTLFEIDGGRLACALPVFRPGKGAVEAHLVAAGRSIVAANSHGYANQMATEGGGTTTGGLAQVELGEHGCHVAWTSDAVSVSAQAVVSRATGLLYTLVKPAGFPDAWNLAALDWRTGETRFEVLAGEGLGHNSEGGAVVLGPDGAAYAGTFGGVVRFAE